MLDKSIPYRRGAEKSRIAPTASMAKVMSMTTGKKLGSVVKSLQIWFLSPKLKNSCETIIDAPICLNSVLCGSVYFFSMPFLDLCRKMAHHPTFFLLFGTREIQYYISSFLNVQQGPKDCSRDLFIVHQEPTDVPIPIQFLFQKFWPFFQR